MMQWIKPGTNFDFVGNRRRLLVISIFLLGGSLLLVATKGLNYGIDFAGGYEFQVRFPKEVQADQVTKILNGAGIENVTVQSYGEGGDKEYLLRLERHSGVDPTKVEAAKGVLKQGDDKNLKEYTYNAESADRVKIVLGTDVGADKIKSAFTAQGLTVKSVDKSTREDRAEYNVALESVADKVEAALRTSLSIPAETAIASRVEFVGPQVGEQLRNQGIMAVFYAFAFMLLYIAFRFDFYFGPGAIVCLFHDVIATVGAFSLTGKEFNLQTIAALLTIIGFSMNDTIVVFDRIRENNVRMKGQSLEAIVNKSLNETLSRTILTTFVTSLVVIALIFLGGGVLADFGFALMVGFIVGTYSSIAVASPVYIALRRRFDSSLRTAGGAPAVAKQAVKA
jgi:preprotein translocase subunit SecF